MASKFIGNWEVQTKTPMGDNTAIWRIKEEDGVVSGIIVADGKDVPFEKIEITGDDFEMMTHLDLQFGHIQFDWKGTATDDTVMGISRMKMGKSKFKGKRID